MINKKEVRQRALELRNALEQSWRAEQSQRIVQRLQQSEQYEKADIILSYSSIRSEVETRALNEAVLRQGKKLYLPKTYPAEKRMSFYPVEDLSQVKKGYQGISEPAETIPLERQFEQSTDRERQKIVMLMPGVAFDSRGYRMGYGGGYYDRYLCHYGIFMTSIFLAFEEQRIQRIPVDEYDRKPDLILTQKGIDARVK